ncbi:MAG: hypothetical protein H7249_15615 [Chitinophagaceae bacterium]|nr:hypothetical protein [Oligoflexus sp.]
MPSYDVECRFCGFEDIAVVSIQALDAWDRDAVCPAADCGGEKGDFRRVLRKAPAGYGGAKATAKSQSSQKADARSRFVTSGAKDDMRHKESKTRDRDQVAAAVENVRKGAFEGF